mmetsp:Transcript_5648/g.12381  ORF Transcript_5648/g.12381 Transcript_5648/m.12381 type:complete len:134 (+) Transcript_5648:1997-2398(+)
MLEILLHFALGEVTADEALGVVDRVLRIRGRLILCGHSDHARAFRVGECDPRGRGARAVGVGHDLDAADARPNHRDTRVGSTQVDADDQVSAVAARRAVGRAVGRALFLVRRQGAAQIGRCRQERRLVAVRRR